MNGVVVYWAQIYMLWTIFSDDWNLIKKLIGLETARNVSFLAIFYYVLNAQVEGLNLSISNFQESFLDSNRIFSTLPEPRITTFFSIRPID